MRVALNAQLLSSAASYRSAGISRVIQHLLAELPASPATSSISCTRRTATPTVGCSTAPRVAARLTRLPVDAPPVRIAWEQTVLPLELLRAGADLLHALGFVSPFAWRGKTVVTVYDLSFLRFPRRVQPRQPRLSRHVHAALAAPSRPGHHDLGGYPPRRDRAVRRGARAGDADPAGCRRAVPSGRRPT